MQKRRYLILTVLALFVFVGIGAYLWRWVDRGEQIFSEKQESIRVDETNDQALRRMVNSVPHIGPLPIRKVLASGSGFEYIIEGVLVSGFSDGEYMDGSFMIDGDPLKREWKMIVGNGGDKTYLGAYEKEFDKKSVWRMEENEIVRSVVLVGSRIEVHVRYFVEVDKGIDKEVKEDESMWDGVIEEYQTGNFHTDVPHDFQAIISQIGILEE